jgi:hypothetical protein
LDAAETLLAIEDIKQLKARYFRCLDTKDWAGLAEVFAEDAWFDARHSRRDARGGDDPGEAAFPRGRDNILAFIRSRVSAMVTVHHGHMPEITILSEDTASGIIAMEDRNRWLKDGQIHELNGFGHYHETYSRIDGRWRIQTSRLTRLRVDIRVTAPERSA